MIKPLCVVYFRTFKQNCPAGIKLEDCQSLIVTGINLHHNHAIGQVSK